MQRSRIVGWSTLGPPQGRLCALSYEISKICPVRTVSFHADHETNFATLTHHAATPRAPPRPVAVCLGVVGPEEAFIALRRLPMASIDIGGLTLMDIERDLRWDPAGISRASLAAWLQGRS
jgi:hypothetical protein